MISVALIVHFDCFINLVDIYVVLVDSHLGYRCVSERYSPLKSCLSIWFIVAIYVWLVSSDLENRHRSSDIQELS